MLNYRIILYTLSNLLLVEAIFMLICAPVSALNGDSDVQYFIISAAITFLFGGVVWFSTKDYDRTLGKREGYIITTLAWIVFSLFGCLPFYLSKQIPSFTDAFFETMSGFTTTGASILSDIEALSHGMLFWRSLTQWLGGMGIIVLSLAILPMLGIGGMQLFVAEVPGPTPDKLHPRIKETAKRLWGIYVILTIGEVLLLVFGEMNLYDAICHSFTTMATGGYSTKNIGMAHYTMPYTHYIVTFFMFIAGVNFTLSYFAMHLNFKEAFRNEEFRFYTGITLIFAIVIAIGLFLSTDYSFEKSFRDALFQVVSILTTTGFATADYMKWIPILTMFVFVLMFIGGSAGSTGGGIKVVRIIVMVKNSFLELKRLIHPNAIIPLRLNTHAITPQIVTNVVAFVSVYFLITLIGALTVSAMGYDLQSSLGAVAATLGNIGPGLGAVGPAENFSHFSNFGKWFLSLLMLIGRLELFTVLVLFTPAFWKS